jgi:enoyl-CoA hydratase/carnithine racemase
MTRQRHRRCLPQGQFMTGHLIVTDEEATRVITLRRPEKKNAITQDMYRAMSDAIDKSQNNPNIRCIIITGGSGVFTAGNDLEDFLKDGTASSDAPRKSNAMKFLYALAHNAKPIVAVMTRTVSASGMDWGVLAAAGVLTIVPGAIVIWFVRHYIARGFAMGRV